jgi:glutamyl-Q tRNA(Asp) synthetase
MSIVTRFAPSPTGFLHLGHAYAAWVAWSKAREAGGEFLLRLEDIDGTRCKPEFAAAICEDLRWLGMGWDGAVRVQSEHLPDYAAALDKLDRQELIYPCFCSRAEIARAQSAPQEAAQGAPHGAEAVYPGTCRDLSFAARAERMAAGDKYARRLDVRKAAEAAGPLQYFEETAGWIEAVPERLGDVVLGRSEIATSYHLCVVCDDAAQGVTHVTRGDDLAGATHIHVLLQRLLGLATPVYAHHRLMLDAQGKRFAKRDNAMTLRAMRESGVTPEDIWRRLRGGPAASHETLESKMI